MFNNLTYEVSEGIATITFIREKALNALNNETVNELEQAISKIKEETADPPLNTPLIVIRSAFLFKK